MSVWMSLIEFSLTTTMRGMRLATRPCIFTKLYQRPMRVALAPVLGVRHLERPVAGDRVVQRDDRRDHLLDAAGCRSRGTGCRARGRSRAGAASARASARMLNASGSPNVPRKWLSASARSALVLISQKPGNRPGKWSFHMSRLGSSCSVTRSSSTGYGWPPNTSTRVAEVDQRLGEVAGVDALATDVRLAAVGEVGDRAAGRRVESAVAPAGVTADIGPSGYRGLVTDR